MFKRCSAVILVLGVLLAPTSADDSLPPEEVARRAIAAEVGDAEAARQTREAHEIAELKAKVLQLEQKAEDLTTFLEQAGLAVRYERWQAIVNDERAARQQTQRRQHRVVFVVDTSGSTIDLLHSAIIPELAARLRGLGAKSEFTVLLSRGRDVEMVPPKGWRSATPTSIEAAVAWMSPTNVTAIGHDGLIKAIQAAAHLEPAKIVVLSDQEFEIAQKSLPQDIAGVVEAGIRVDTIAFAYRDPLEALGLEPTLKLIADLTGGRYEFLSDDQLRRRHKTYR